MLVCFRVNYGSLHIIAEEQVLLLIKLLADIPGAFNVLPVIVML